MVERGSNPSQPQPIIPAHSQPSPNAKLSRNRSRAADGGMPCATARGGSLLGALLPGLAFDVIHVRAGGVHRAGRGPGSVPGGWVSRPWDLCRRLRNRESDDVCCRVFPWCLPCAKAACFLSRPIRLPSPLRAYLVWKLMNLTSVLGPPPGTRRGISTLVRSLSSQPS